MATVLATAFAVEIPFFFYGTPSGHDVEFHLYSWLEVLGQWKHGIVFPRWASLANFGYGEPRFIFYPPASWLLGGALSLVFPWRIVASVYIWLVLSTAGVSMFLLARRWMDRRDAIFAAALYAANPYHLVIVYWRSAFAELLASCLVPLLFLLVLKAADEGRRAIVPLALVLAAAWLTNAPAAVMIHYSLALLILVLAWQRRSARVVLVAAVAISVGACLAAFYLLPAIYEQKWVTIAEAVSQGSRPLDNFLFVHTTDAEHDRFNRIVSWAATAEIVATLGALWTARRWREAQKATWNCLAGWALMCALLMFSFSGVVWKLLPKLQFMQFPWRWLLCLSMIFSVATALGVRRWWTRVVICLAMLFVLVVAWRKIQSPWWDTAADLREMQDNVATGAGYEGVDEYTPIAANVAAIDKSADRVSGGGSQQATIQVLRWDAELKEFTVDASTPSQLALQLFSYPAWWVEINGRAVRTTHRAKTGQILVPVEAGMNRVTIRFTRLWDRTLGGWISVASALGLLGGWWIGRGRTSP